MAGTARDTGGGTAPIDVEATHPRARPSLRDALEAVPARLRVPTSAESWTQVVVTFGLFFAVTGLVHAGLNEGRWEAMLLVLPLAGLAVRIFIIQHDCGHRSLFTSVRVNDWVGRACSVITLTPFEYWRRMHNGHHARWNCLETRGPTIDPFSACLTTEEYAARSPGRRLRYRAARHPIVMFLLLPPLVFVLLYRVPLARHQRSARDQLSVHGTTLAAAAWILALATLSGVDHALLVQLSGTVLAAIVGAWLFFVQHQFESAAWIRRKDWQFGDAVVSATSYLHLPGILRWFTGNIGFHNVHHLSPAIPNYRLSACHDALGPRVAFPKITLAAGIRSTRLTLWDSNAGEMISFATFHRRRPDACLKRAARTPIARGGPPDLAARCGAKDRRPFERR